MLQNSAKVTINPLLTIVPLLEHDFYMVNSIFMS